ncbi:uncharacterized protein TNCV_1111151 [Trichonephila clavipes]|nr:uncharacterized protein TNCV_1111151 [Trichonephila clavipes]
MPGETISTIVKVKDKIYLFSVSNKDSDSILNLYEWMETQFDSVTSLSLKGSCKSLDAREMNFDIIIALSMDQEKLIIFHFSESDQFTEFQEISSDLEPVVDISTFKAFNELVVIIITKTSHVEYYFQNNASLLTLYGKEHFEMKLKTTTMWNNRGVLILLPLTEDGLILPVNPRLNFPVSFPVLKQNHPPQNCSQQVYKMLNVIADEIHKSNSKLHNVWIKDKEYWISTVHVNGSVTSNKAAEIGRVSFSDDSGSLDAQFVSNFVSRLKEKTENLSEILKKAVMKSENQGIFGNIEFVNGIVADYVINVTELKHNLDLNGINTSKLSSTLKIKGNQIIPNEFKLNGMGVTRVNTTFLNKNRCDGPEFMSRAGQGRLSISSLQWVDKLVPSLCLVTEHWGFRSSGQSDKN